MTLTLFIFQWRSSAQKRSWGVARYFDQPPWGGMGWKARCVVSDQEGSGGLLHQVWTLYDFCHFSLFFTNNIFNLINANLWPWNGGQSLNNSLFFQWPGNCQLFRIISIRKVMYNVSDSTWTGISAQWPRKRRSPSDVCSHSPTREKSTTAAQPTIAPITSPGVPPRWDLPHQWWAIMLWYRKYKSIGHLTLTWRGSFLRMNKKLFSSSKGTI